MDPIPEPLLRRKFGIAGNRTQDLWVSSQEFWSLDHRGGPSVYIPSLMSETKFHTRTEPGAKL
jgi:hypothetical protein